MGIMKMIINGAAITVAAIVGYNIIKHTMKKNLRFDEQTSTKKQSWQNFDKVDSTLSNSHWKKIGKVAELAIYPVKSSKRALVYDSCEFRDYGMCVSNYETYFWDGMFIVYNKTKGKFEDSRRYPELQSILAVLCDTANVLLYKMTINGSASSAQLNIYRDRNPFKLFLEETWNGTLEAYYSSNNEINTWVKNTIVSDQINGTDEDVILAHMLPRNWDSTQKIRDNWFHFVQGYNTMKEDETGKLITLPRFVLISTQTNEEIKRDGHNPSTPNIIVETNESMSSFAEKYWDWIRIGDDVFLKNVKSVPSNDERFEHYGIYCGLWSGGNVKLDDEVFIYCGENTTQV